MRYTIEEYVFNDYNASSKARKDVSYFVLQNGFQSLFKNDKTKIQQSKLAKLFLTLKLYLKIIRLKQKDILFVQTSLIVLKPILKIKAIRKFKIIYLIHDVFSLRYDTPDSINKHSREIKKDINILSKCDCIIAHNQFMINRLQTFGCTSKLVSLEIFDYKCLPNSTFRQLNLGEGIKIAFAANLANSPFLSKLEQLSKNHNFRLILYGNQPKFQIEKSIYKGQIDPDILPNKLEGHFGLVWAGDFHNTEKDNYLKISNPHKTSLYLAAGLPVIIWSKCAIAKFIKDNDLGICIDSLDDLPQILTQITPQTYSIMVNNCRNMSVELIKGQHISNALNNSIALLK